MLSPPPHGCLWVRLCRYLRFCGSVSGVVCGSVCVCRSTCVSCCSFIPGSVHVFLCGTTCGPDCLGLPAFRFVCCYIYLCVHLWFGMWFCLQVYLWSGCGSFCYLPLGAIKRAEIGCGRTGASWMLGKEHELDSHATNLLLIRSSQAPSGM